MEANVDPLLTGSRLGADHPENGVLIPCLFTALCAASSKTDQAAIDRIVGQHGRDSFLAAWLRHRGVAWAADLIPDLNNLESMP